MGDGMKGWMYGLEREREREKGMGMGMGMMMRAMYVAKCARWYDERYMKNQ